MAKSSKTYLGVHRGTVPGVGTLDEVARDVGCTKAALSLFERGERSLSPETVKRYAKAIRTPEARVWQLHYHESIRWHERKAAAIKETLRRGKPLGKALVAVG